jgi:phosphatidyl-myo-inositol alpha-mannosyltransferase
VAGDAGPGGDATPPLRVAMVCPYDLSRPGGVQGQAVGLARALRRRGHEVVVVAPDDRPPGWASGHAYVAGRSVGLHANGSVAPVSLSPLAAKRAYDAVREWRADVVHLHEPLAPAVGYGFVLAGRWPLVGTFHRSGVPRAAALVAPFARWACGRIQVRVAVSDAARRTATATCGADPEVLFNGVDVERFACAEPVRPGAPAVLFLARHEHRKGLGVLLDAFRGLSGTAGVPDAELWIANVGPETERLRARHPASDHVHWLGVVSDDEAADRLAGASVLCAPSLGGESFGMVLLEAMAARCPVVASDIPGYREAAGGHATLVAPGDPVALRDALAGVLSARPAPDALDAAARHAAVWSIDALAGRYVEAYRRAGNLAGR